MATINGTIGHLWSLGTFREPGRLHCLIKGKDCSLISQPSQYVPPQGFPVGFLAANSYARSLQSEHPLLWRSRSSVPVAESCIEFGSFCIYIWRGNRTETENPSLISRWRGAEFVKTMIVYLSRTYIPVALRLV